LILSLLLKALIGTTAVGRRWDHPTVTLQNGLDGTSGHHGALGLCQARFDLAGAPAILITHRQHPLLDRLVTAPRRVLRPARALLQPGCPALFIALPPLVASLATDPKARTQLAEIGSRLTG